MKFLRVGCESPRATPRTYGGDVWFDLRDDEVGRGAFLMVDPDLPRTVSGLPWQAFFYFDRDQRPTRLVTDEFGRPLGGPPFGLRRRDPKPEPLPEAVAAAAIEALRRARADGEE